MRGKTLSELREAGYKMTSLIKNIHVDPRNSSKLDVALFNKDGDGYRAISMSGKNKFTVSPAVISVG